MVRWCCRLGVVFVETDVRSDSGDSWTAGIIPAGYRPDRLTWAAANISTSNNVGNVVVGADGNVTCQWSGIAGWLYANLSYPVG